METLSRAEYTSTDLKQFEISIQAGLNTRDRL